MVNFDNERKYLITMLIFKKMLAAGTIDQADYDKLDAIFREKYTSCFSVIFLDNNTKQSDI